MALKTTRVKFQLLNFCSSSTSTQVAHVKKITGCRTEIGGFWPLVQGGYTSTLTTVYGTKLTPVEEEISFLVILWTSDVNIIIIF